MLLVERVSTISAQMPDAVAVTQNKASVTYRDLDLLKNKIANLLLSLGMQKGDRAAMLMANSADYIGIFYGIWTAGGVTVSLNTQAKARDIINWTSHSASKWLFIDSTHPELATIRSTLKTDTKLILVSGSSAYEDCISWSQVCNADETATLITLSENDIASIIYTSGTSGKPKGVTLSHGNLSSNVDSILAYLELDKDDSIVNVLPFYYSYGNSVLHTHISVGAKLVLENSLLYPHAVIEKIIEEGASGFSGVPSTFSLLLGRVKLEDYDLSCLRYITQAGGPMSPTTTDKLRAVLPDAKIFIMYGQTEASARLTYLPHNQLETKRGSVGIAIPGVEISIMDDSGQQVASGDMGEICARGPNIMLGYWKDIEKTDSVLKNGWLHTGDLGHYDKEGYIYIDGRSSDMIKTGGNRISPKEVEEVIQEIPGVQEVAVIGVADKLLGESIMAFIVPDPNIELTTREIQLYCKQNLALYKVPKAIKLMDDLPKTASGKIQRFKLK